MNIEIEFQIPRSNRHYREFQEIFGSCKWCGKMNKTIPMVSMEIMFGEYLGKNNRVDFTRWSFTTGCVLVPLMLYSTEHIHPNPSSIQFYSIRGNFWLAVSSPDSLGLLFLLNHWWTNSLTSTYDDLLTCSQSIDCPRSVQSNCRYINREFWEFTSHLTYDKRQTEE